LKLKKLVNWKGWDWAAKTALRYLGVHSQEIGVSLTSLMTKEDGAAFPVELAVTVRDRFSGQISCQMMEAVAILQAITSALSTELDQSSVTLSDQTGSSPEPVQLSLPNMGGG